MATKETAAASAVRWQKLEILQQHYREFTTFLPEVMGLLGFSTTEIQYDIAQYMAHGPQYLMVQAQRGQAKTTIAAAYSVWCLIQDPTYRVLIISAGGTQASEISTLIIRIIMTMPELECLHPDTNNGDRSSVDHFDVHYALKGVDKSPSVACVGITAQLQGKRADLLLADDVESTKNSTTAVQRAQLLHLTLDFVSISMGRIIWLGTPQTSDSIYNTLPGRGVQIRIWPGRYPTQEQLDNYGDHLAPLLQRRMERNPALMVGGGVSSDQGQPTDPQLMDEAKLQAKELDQGTSYFQLQHMLNTRLVDRLRYPLKAEQLVAITCQNTMPISVVRGMTSASLKDFKVHGHGFKMQTPHELSKETAKFQGIIAYVDPAGGGANADETAYAVTAFLNGNIFLLDVGGLPGGYAPAVMQELAERVLHWRPSLVKIEKNMGFGAFREVFSPILAKVAKEMEHTCGTDEDYVTGQKEPRIIATLEPIINQGRLLVNPAVVERDAQDCQRYAAAQRLTYSFFFQLAKITKDRGALVHDDRLDAVEGAVRHWQDLLRIDQQRQVELQRQRERAEILRDPLGHHRYGSPEPRYQTMLSRYRR
jgi:hypothetical protein